MKRVRPISPEPSDEFAWKEPKFEELDGKYFNDFPYKEVKEEGDSLKVPKDEILDEGPTSSNIPKWQPNLNNFLFESNDDLTELDCGMSLGTSVLFEKAPADTDNRNYDATEDYPDNPQNATVKKALTSYQLPKAMNACFQKNSHPTAKEMQEISDHYNIRYTTVWDNFEKRRNKFEIKCEIGDPCMRIKRFIASEKEKCFPRLSNEEKMMVMEELETHLLSRKTMTLGYVHILMEKIDVPPCYIRTQFEMLKRKFLTKNPEEFRPPASIDVGKLKVLEKAYLEKKYHSKEKEWGTKDYERISEGLNMSPEDVSDWIEKRSSVNYDLDHNAIEFRRDNDAKLQAFHVRKLPVEKKVAMNKFFYKNPYPGRTEIRKLAAMLELSDIQVRNYLSKKRREERKQEDWKDAKREFDSLPDRVKIEMLEIARGPKKLASEYKRISARLGVTYTTLVSFVEWQKVVN